MLSQEATIAELVRGVNTAAAAHIARIEFSARTRQPLTDTPEPERRSEVQHTTLPIQQYLVDGRQIAVALG